MQIKNRIIFIIICFLNLSGININLYADEFNISAIEITIDKKNEIVIGKGSVEISDKQGRIIKADNATYEKTKEFLLTEGSVEFFDTEGNTITTDRATYDKKNEIITTYNNSELTIKEGYKLTSNKVLYNTTKKSNTFSMKIISFFYFIIHNSNFNINFH